jgi:hypothetical protein
MDRRLGSYVDAGVVNILTIKPSQPSLTDSSKNAWISSVDDPSDDLAKANSPSTSLKLSCNICRLSFNSFVSRLCLSASGSYYPSPSHKPRR